MVRVEIKSLGNALISAVAEIETQAFGDDGFDKSGIAKLVAGTADNNSISACIGNGQLAGYAIYKIRDSKIYIVTIAVEQTLRRQTIGTQIINHIKRIAKLRKRQLIEILVSQDSFVAQKFFASADFRVDKSLDNEMTEHNQRGAYRFRHNPHHCTVDLKNRISE